MDELFATYAYKMLDMEKPGGSIQGNLRELKSTNINCPRQSEISKSCILGTDHRHANVTMDGDNKLESIQGGNSKT